MHESHTTEKYYAAANTYGGFKSYFNDVFNPSEYDKLYILKGGPGTGKSSLMKRFAKDLSVCGCRIEEIYCSSDPRSLDGIIATYNDKRIAIIDGTAPHESDAKIPGACDEIINLGIAWDSRWLSGERERIIGINKEKGQSYKSAYLSLSIAGAAHNAENAYFADLYDVKNANIEIKRLADSVDGHDSGSTQIRLISSFCKHGLTRLNTLESRCANIFSIVGTDYTSTRFLTDLSQEFKRRSKKITVFPSPLDPTAIEAILIPDASTCFVVGGNGKQIDTERFLKKDAIISEKIKCAKECHTLALQDSMRWFSVAAELHFALEEIYTRAMNFDIIDRIYDEKFSEVCDILKLSA